MYRVLPVGMRRAVLICCAALMLACTANAQHYRIVDLGKIAGYGVNASGAVAGAGAVGDTGHAFLWVNGKARDLGVLPGGVSSWATGINNAGEVTGAGIISSPSLGYLEHAFLVRSASSRMIDLGTLYNWAYSQSFAINNLEEVVGETVSPTGDHNASGFYWSKATGMKGLHPIIGGNMTRGTAINDLSQIAGFGNTPAGRLVWHACVWMKRNLVPIDLGTMPNFATASSANGINRSTTVVGYASSTRGSHAFLWTKAGGMKDLGTLSAGGYSVAVAINDSDVVVGIAGTDVNQSPQNAHAFVWTKAGGMKDLNTLIPRGTGWFLQFANAINASGEITGTGVLRGENHGFVLIPAR